LYGQGEVTLVSDVFYLPNVGAIKVITNAKLSQSYTHGDHIMTAVIELEIMPAQTIEMKFALIGKLHKVINGATGEK
jgi:hypothetical protein